MRLTEREQDVLAIIFASGEPIEIQKIAEALETTTANIISAVDSLSLQLKNDCYPLEIKKLNTSYQICTCGEFEGKIRKALTIGKNIPLSPAAMETLAVIAYNQPVTRLFIEQVRGVDSNHIVSTLLEKGLIEEAGRLDLPGKPISLKTTDVFLRCFGLESIDDLPEVLEEDYIDDMIEENTELNADSETQEFTEV